jgi:hypothetical protein
MMSINWDSLCRDLVAVMGHFLWQGLAVMLIALAVASVVRAASVRYWVWVGALVVMLACPVVTWVMRWDVARPLSASSVVTPAKNRNVSAIPAKPQAARESGFTHVPVSSAHTIAVPAPVRTDVRFDRRW